MTDIPAANRKPMRTNLLSRLGGENLSIGLAACVIRTPEIVTVARSTGFDFLLIDQGLAVVSRLRSRDQG